MKAKKERENKKMNPIWVILVFVILAIVVVYKLGINNENNKYKLEAIYQEYNNEVDSGTTTLLNHPGFERLSKIEQVSEMGKLLAMYEQKGVIVNLYYSEDSYMYTFQYNTGSISGALGGVSLKAWDPYMN
ncbi:MAG: hypothetical protein IKL68_02425 [Clostridia bacterium]|nr:hypothetical protein [Clostridia bacterium]